MLRRPAVAGQFYPASKTHLESEVKKYLTAGIKPRDVIGIISPHAGYVYSGHVAGAVFASVDVPEKVIVLSPNHTGLGKPASIMPEGQWEIPTGIMQIDSELAGELMKNCSELAADITAHLKEHSLEVQLPFIQDRQPKAKIVPITLSHLRFDVCEKIGHAIAKTIKELSPSPLMGEGRGEGGRVLIVASSDMTHYEPHEIAKEKDMRAINKVIALDPKGLLDLCARERITMCGVIPSAVMLIAAKELGAKKGELIKYATSGDVSGDYSSVVGYAGVIVH